MTNRREFLQAATALSAAPLVSRATFAGVRDTVHLDAVIYDNRYTQAQYFGARARRLGAEVHEITGDITDLWQQELLQRWQNNPAAILGLTERPALFLLERLAWDHGLRVMFEAEHVTGAIEPVHRITRPGNTSLQRGLAIAGQDWPAILAESLIDGDRIISPDTSPTGSALAGRLDEPTTLVSWVIGPRGGA